MTIQWSVLLWTVICFLLLVLILDRLLFRPVLELLDRRRERVRRAAEKQAEHKRLEAEYAAQREERQAAAAARQKKQLRAQLDQVRTDGRARVEAANLERVRTAPGCWRCSASGRTSWPSPSRRA